MFAIIKNSYKFFIFNFPRILWIVSGLLFLELSSKWLTLNQDKGLWIITLLILFKVVIAFTQIFVIIDLTKLVLAEKIPANENYSLVYMKVFGLTLLINVTIYGLLLLIEHFIPETLLTSIPFLILQLIMGFFVFVYIYARINIVIPLILAKQKITSLFSITKGRYTSWLLACLIVYQPFIILSQFADISYFLLIVKVFFFSLIYIFSAMYLKNKIDN